MDKLARDPEARLYAQAACKADACLFINDFLWTYDPREKCNQLPFILFPRQEEFIQWLVAREDNEEDGLCEKSRDFGMTWLAGAYATWRWLFFDGWRAGFGSRKLELVDKLGDFKAIFPKIRYMIDTLPVWLRPMDYSAGYCLIHNKDNEASISGEGGDGIGRGDRTKVYFVDESAFLERPKQVDAALSQTTRVRIDLSTVHGNTNSFAMRRHSGAVPVFTAHWKDDPRKNHYTIYDAKGQAVAKGNFRPEENGHTVPDGGRVVYPWYEREKIRLNDPVIIAQELDIDYTASIEGVCIPANHVMAAVDLVKRIPHLPQGGDVIGAIDLAEDGGNKNVLGFRRGVVVLEEPEGEEKILNWTNPSQSYTANKAKEESLRHGAKVLNYDTGGGFGGAVADMGRDMENEWQEADHDTRMQLIGQARAQEGEEATREFVQQVRQSLTDLKSQKLPFSIVPRTFGGATSETEWPDGKKASEKFLNARAEWWFILRDRFRKTYEYVEHGVRHPLDELISIPNHAQLIADLSKPLIVYAAGDKFALEPKAKMRKRGVSSPDFADMLAMLFAPKPESSWSTDTSMMDTLSAFYRGEVNAITGTAEDEEEADAVADLDDLLNSFTDDGDEDEPKSARKPKRTRGAKASAEMGSSNADDMPAIVTAPKANLSLKPSPRRRQ